MSRKIFFSFHFERDVWRAGQVRNSNLLADEDRYGFVDAAEWEEIEREGDDAIRRWINDQLKNTSVTVVLVGAATAERDWVDYEIRKSWARGNALLAIRIHNVKDQDGKTDVAGSNPLDNVHLANGKALSTICKTYDWVNDDGRNNLGKWAEEAHQARKAYTGETDLQDDSKAEKASPRVTPVAAPTIIKNPPGPWAH